MKYQLKIRVNTRGDLLPSRRSLRRAEINATKSNSNAIASRESPMYNASQLPKAYLIA